jgi:hypothetical protein
MIPTFTGGDGEETILLPWRQWNDNDPVHRKVTMSSVDVSTERIG